MAKVTFSSSTPAAGAVTAPLADLPVFIDTNLGTHLAMVVTDQETVADLKRKIMDEHPRCFPDHGQITIQAMKVRRKSFFYHLSDAMLVRSAFHGNTKAWFVHVDASSACLKPEHDGQLQKHHVPSCEMGTSKLPDSEAVQTHITANDSASDKDIIQPDSNADNFLKATLCDPPANGPSIPNDSSIPQVGTSSPEKPALISSDQEGDVPRASSPVAQDLASELDASLDFVKGSDHRVAADSGLINSENEVLETQNPPKDDGMIDQTENLGRDNRVNNDQDRPELMDNHSSKRRSGELQLEDDTRENLKVATKKHRKGKENDVTVKSVENPLQDVRSGTTLAESSISIFQTDEPQKLSSLNACHDTHKSIETVAEVATESLVVSVEASEIDGTKGKKHRKRKEKYVEPVENPSKDVRAGATLAKGSLSIPQTDEPDKVSSLNASCEKQKFTETVAGVAAESLGGVDASETGDSKRKKRQKRKEKDFLVEPVKSPSKGVRTGATNTGGSRIIIQTDEPDKLSSLNVPQETHDSEAVAGNAVESLVGHVDTSEINVSKVETKGDDTSAQAVALGDKTKKKSRKRRAVRSRSSNAALVEEHEADISDITPIENENAITGGDHVDIHQNFNIGNEDSALPMVKELKTMASEAKNCEDGVDSLKLAETTEGTGMVDLGGNREKRPKKSKVTDKKSHTSHSGVEYINDKGELAALESNSHGLDDNHDENHNCRDHGFDDPNDVENGSSQTKRKEILKISQSDNVSGNELCPPKLDPMCGTEDIVDLKEEKVKRKSKKTRSNAKSVPEPSMELQDGVHKSSGYGQNFDIHQTSENKKEGETMLRMSGNGKEDNASPRKKKVAKSHKTSSRNQLLGSMLEGEDNGVDSKSSHPGKVSKLEASVDGSQSEANNHDINFVEFFVPRAAESEITGKELSTSKKTPERTTKRTKKSEVGDDFIPLKKPRERTKDTIELQVSSSEDKDNHTHHCGNETSVIADADTRTQPDRQHDYSLGGQKGNKATKSKIGDVFSNNSFVHSSVISSPSKVNVKASEERKNASEGASSANTQCLDGTIYISKRGKKIKLRSNQYYISVNGVPDKKLGEVSNNSNGEKNSLSTPNSMSEHANNDGSEDKGGENDSEVSTNITTDNSSSSAYLDDEEERLYAKTPTSRRKTLMDSAGTDDEEERPSVKTLASRKKTHMDSAVTGLMRSVAHDEKNEENDGNDIVQSQTVDNGVKNMSIGMLLRKSSSYRKAKITSSQSRVEDTESQPVDFVPDSLVAQDFYELHLSQ